MDSIESPKPPTSPPPVALAAELRPLISKLKRRLRGQGRVGDLTASQASTLRRLLKDGPLTTSELARAEGLRPQSMAAITRALQVAGLVVGTPDPTDGRQTRLSVTDACRQRLHDHRAAREDWLARALASRLSPEEQVHLASAVTLLKRLVEE